MRKNNPDRQTLRIRETSTVTCTLVAADHVLLKAVLVEKFDLVVQDDW